MRREPLCTVPRGKSVPPMAEPHVGGGTSAALGRALLPRCPTDLTCETQKVHSSHSRWPTASRGCEEHGVTPPGLRGSRKAGSRALSLPGARIPGAPWREVSAPPHRNQVQVQWPSVAGPRGPGRLLSGPQASLTSLASPPDFRESRDSEGARGRASREKQSGAGQGSSLLPQGQSGAGWHGRGHPAPYQAGESD